MNMIGKEITDGVDLQLSASRSNLTDLRSYELLGEGGLRL